LNSVDAAIDYIRKNIKNTQLDTYGNHIKFSINGKIFAIIYKGKNPHIILKAEGRFNKKLRKEYRETVMPSYTINSYHWNMIFLDKELTDNIIFRLISNSHDEVVSNMTRRQKDTYDYIMTTT